MSSIPKDRADLVRMITTSFARLQADLERVNSTTCELPCTEEWSIRQLLAVRVWWTEAVVEWVRAGQRGEVPVIPAPGYLWKDTPRLNAEIVAGADTQTWHLLCGRLERGVLQVLATIEKLDNHELLTPGVFEWTGKSPVARLLSMNTSTQYATARTLVRRALRGAR